MMIKNSWVPVAYNCNPSCLGGWRLGGSQFEASPCKKETPSQPTAEHDGDACHPSYTGG
jgi:hypothetical protein